LEPSLNLKTRSLTAWLAALVVLPALASACASEPSAPLAAPRTLDEKPQPELPPLVGNPSVNEPPRADARSESKQPAPGGPVATLLAQDLQGLFTDQPRREADFVGAYTTYFKDALSKARWFKKLTTHAYEARKYALLFTSKDQATPARTALVAALRAVGNLGLELETYKLGELDTRSGALDQARVAYDAATQPDADPRAEDLWGVYHDLRGMTALDAAGMATALLAKGLTDGDRGRIAGLKGRLDRLFTARQKLNEALVDLDVFLLSAWFRYVYDMRYALRAHPFYADKTDGEGVERAAEALYAHYTSTDFTNLEAALEALVPRIPEYKAMVEGLAFYRGLAAGAPQVMLPNKAAKLGRGAQGETVKLLADRLIQEAYLDGPPPGSYGDALAEAVRLYQEVHQIKETGDLDVTTLRSLNVPYLDRAKHIVLGLRRHRESDLHQGTSRFGDVSVQARINIAKFEAVFYKEGEPARAHRLVVGNNLVETDEETGLRGYFNRTRMISEELNTVVLNPTWRVPKRIKEQELDNELMKEPDYYEKHGYAVRILDDGSEEVVQLPGPQNALGLVKFLFPNRFSIYMHDTPKKKLFNRTIRTFSHGCMRTENPLELARWLLIEVQGMPAAKFEKVLDAREEYGVVLENKVPLTVEYNTVSVHESGRTMFLADVYGYDRDYADAKTPYPKQTSAQLEQVVLTE
jgi:murein L,D-transpeptidase YcbB/YkuD